MTIAEYIVKHAADSVKVDIIERWESRIVAQGMHLAGRSGAENYIANYGKAMKAPKCIGFARCAELKGFPLLADRFWEEAFFLETGERVCTAGPMNHSPKANLPTVPLKTGFGHYPQLLVMVDRATALRLAIDPLYGVQEKKDGERVMVKVEAGVVTAGNKKSLTRPLPLNVASVLLRLGPDFVADGELIGTTLYLFDLLQMNSEDLRDKPFAYRHAALELLVDITEAEMASLQIVPLVTGEDKLGFIEALESEGKEGFVLKNLSAGYQAGEKHQTQWKHQFRAITACIAGERSPSGKEAVEVFVLRKDGSKRSMGMVTTIGKVVPAPGQIVEIQNLYTHTGPDGKFAQAVLLGIRSDADASDCREDKLRVKEMAS